MSGEAAFASAYDAFLAASPLSFSLPGHKRALDDPLLAFDAAYVPGVEDAARSGRLLERAEAAAAAAWGAGLCRFSVAGSTMANQALLLGVARPGDRIAVARTAHASSFNGLVLSGLKPVWLRADGATGVAVADVERALDDGARAVLLVEPSYTGTLSDLPAVAAATRAAGVPLLVDQAWGAHFGFAPSVPSNALQQGADAMVTSVHKTLTGFTQTALLLALGDRLDLDRLDRAFEALHTTSPSAALLASIDRARALADASPHLIDRAAALAAGARERLGEADALRGVPRFDPLKVVVDLAPSGADGFAVERELRDRIHLEMADRDTIVPVVTLADDDASVDALVTALLSAIDRHRGEPRERAASFAAHVDPEVAMTPRDAFFAPTEIVAARDAVGRIAAEAAAPYPPGIPVIAPGEVITAELLAALQAEAATGTRIAFASDPMLERLLVVER